jgi:DNA-binding transcriptional ArsR family regulator
VSRLQRPSITATEVFKALGDPIRWSIVEQMATVDELACSRLEDTLPISKPTISYHMKILVQAGLVAVRKEGRNFHYTLRRDVLRGLVDDIWTLAPAPRPVRGGKIDHKPVTSRRRRAEALRDVQVDQSDEREAVLLTW